jgi:hypothetical protein
MIVNWIRSAFLRKLGTCGYCMRMNLRGALAGWVITIAAAYFEFRHWYLILPWPVAFTGLWALHVTTYAGRTMNAISRIRRAGPTTAPVTRRLIFIHGLRATALVILSSMAIPEIAAAQNSAPPPPPGEGIPSDKRCQEQPCPPVDNSGLPYCACVAGIPYGCVHCPADARWFALAKQNTTENPATGCYPSRDDCENDGNDPSDCTPCDDQHV